MSLAAFSLAGQHVVVVGASSGIGRATALRCAEAGARLSFCARRAELLEGLLGEMTGSEHGYRTLDVANVDQIGSVLDAFVEKRGPIDGLVYAAGTNLLRPLNVIRKDPWDQLQAVNLRGAVFCCQAATMNPRAAREGMSLVLIGSAGARKPGGSGMVAYAASKAALEGATRAMAVEGARRKIRVNAVAPAAVRTEMWDATERTEEQIQKILERHPLGVGSVDDVAYACVYLLSAAAKWITGSVLAIDGGYFLV